MVSNPSTKAVGDKPAKPYPDFPLFPHSVHQWAKKVRGRMCYFGPWADWKAALAKWESQKDALLAGRKPREGEDDGEGLTLRALVNKFLTAKRRRVDAGEMKTRTFVDYYDAAERTISQFGAGRLVSDIRPEDFEAFKAKLAAKWGAVRLGNEIQRIRTIFKYGFENVEGFGNPVRFGSEFAKPSRKIVRLQRAAKPQRFLEANEVRAIIEQSAIPMTAMILLAVNCGLGNTDISELNWDHLDLDHSILNFPRPKTGIDRRAMLWPETVKALREVQAWASQTLTTGEGRGLTRYRPEKREDAKAVFLTKFQERWVRNGDIEDLGDGSSKPKRSITDSVGLEFGKLLRRVKVRRGKKSEAIKRKGVNFYSLRHVFETIAGETGDQAAVDRIMGHADESMAANYRVWRGDERENARLRKVADHVREWLWPNAHK